MTLFDKIRKIDDRARLMGFVWPNHSTIIEQARSECEEIESCIEEAESQERLQEEVGDLLLTTLQLCFFYDFNPQEILEKTGQKFSRRLEALSSVMKSQGLSTLEGQSAEEIMILWEKAKNQG